MAHSKGSKMSDSHAGPLLPNICLNFHISPQIFHPPPSLWAASPTETVFCLSPFIFSNMRVAGAETLKPVQLETTIAPHTKLLLFEHFNPFVPICLLDKVIQSRVTYITAGGNNPVNRPLSVSSSGNVMLKFSVKKLGNPGLPFPALDA